MRAFTSMAGLVARTALAAAVLFAFLVLSGCQGGVSVDDFFPKAEKPLPADIVKTMKAKGMVASSPIMLRIYKQENLVEVWKATDTGRYDLLKEYEICKWSGKLGPKFVEGDRQAPEGFYTINPWQMNPKSQYHLAFNLGFPNSYDRANGRTGTHLMVHGACSSAGCYSMTDERIEEIFSLARESFKGGQESFQVQAYPFKMTAQNMAEHQDSEHFEFWKMLKEGYDHFEITRSPPKVDICNKRYVFNRIAEDEKSFKPQEACPQTVVPDSLALAYGKLISMEDQIFQKALKTRAVKEAWAGRKAELPTDASIKPDEMPVPASVMAPPPLQGDAAKDTAGAAIAQPGVENGAEAAEYAVTDPAAVPVPEPAPDAGASRPAKKPLALTAGGS